MIAALGSRSTALAVTPSLEVIPWRAVPMARWRAVGSFPAEAVQSTPSWSRLAVTARSIAPLPSRRLDGCGADGGVGHAYVVVPEVLVDGVGRLVEVEDVVDAQQVERGAGRHVVHDLRDGRAVAGPLPCAGQARRSCVHPTGGGESVPTRAA